MKILYDNILESAGFFSTPSASGPYIAANLTDQYLEKQYQVADDAATLTAVLGDASDINCIFWGYHNLASLSATFTPGGTVGGAISADRFGALHFTVQEAVTQIDFALAGNDSPIYLGGLATGKAVTFPAFVAAMNLARFDPSSVLDSKYGQSQQKKIRSLRSEAYTWRNMTMDQRDEFVSMYEQVGLGGKIWIDPTWRNHSVFRPMYCKIDREIEIKKVSGMRYDITLAFRETS